MRTKFFMIAVGAIMLIASCKKSDTQSGTADALASLNGSWYTSAWGGVNNNSLTFVISSSAATGVITQIGSQTFNFAVGDMLLQNITAGSNGTYNCIGKYTYGTNNQSTSTRAAVLTLQNNNTQLTVDYPALNASFPEIVYVYQKH